MPIDRDEFVVVTRLEVDGDIPGLRPATDKVVGLEKQARSTGLGISSALNAAFYAVAAGGGLAAVSLGIVGIQTEIENAELGLASLLNAQRGYEMADALGVARDQITGLRADAAKGVGELDNYAAAFQGILGVSQFASLDEIRSLTRLSLTAGFALRGQEGLRLAPMDIQQSLTAGVGERTTPIVIQALRAMGFDPSQFNDLAPEQRFKTLQQAFGQFEEAADAMGRSWDARMATLQDSTKEIARTATAPIFDRWSGQLEEANTYLSEHREELTEIADNVGPRLVAVYDQMLAKGGELSAIGLGLGAGRVAMGATVGRGVGLGTAARGLGAFAVGALAVEQAIEQQPERLVELAASLDALGAASTSVLDALGPLPGLLGGVGGLVIDSATLQLSTMASGLDTAAIIGDGVGGLGEAVAKAYVRSFMDPAGAIAGLGDDIVPLVTGLRERVDQHNRKVLGLDAPEAAGPPLDPDTFVGPKAPVSNNNTYIDRVNVTIKAERMDDPNVVARSIEDVFGELAKYSKHATARTGLMG